jgi:hypothetical protein
MKRWSTMLVMALLGARVALAQTPAPSPPAPAPSPEPPAVKVTPYGTLYFNGFANGDAVNNQDVPLWVVGGGSGDVSATARQTRFGLRASLPDVFGAKTSAVVETDFFGGFPAIGTGENFGQVRLRLASARFEWARTALVVGQDWMVFAPVNPASLASAAIPLFAAGGNPWARIPQLRLERRLGHVLTQAAALAPQSGDFGSQFLAQPNSGALSEQPYLQGRLAVTSASWLGWGKPGAVGVSGHYGQSRIVAASRAPQDLTSKGVAADVSVPLGRHVSLSGEAYAGENLAGFQAGVFQGVNPDATGATPSARGIASKGGWAQLAVAPAGWRVSVAAAYGVDDPDDEDLQSTPARNWRLENRVAAFGVTVRCSPQLSVGAEYRRIETTFRATGVQDGHHVNLAAVLAF